MSTVPENEWVNAEDKRWGQQVRQGLAQMPTVPAKIAGEAILEAQLAVRDSGRLASELFGSPATFVEEVASQRVPADVRAGVGLDGIPSQDRWKVPLLSVGIIGMSLSIGFFIMHGWMVTLTQPGLALLGGGSFALVGAYLGLSERHAGRIQWGWAWWSFGLAGLVASAFIAAKLSDTAPLFELPILLPFLVSILTLCVTAGLRRTASPVNNFSNKPPETWFSQFSGILQGRYGLSRKETQHQLAEAKSFWHESGSAHPFDEFGAPEVYALEILEYSPKPRRAQHRREAGLYTLITLMFVVMAVDKLAVNGQPWGALLPLLGVGIFGFLAAQNWRK